MEGTITLTWGQVTGIFTGGLLAMWWLWRAFSNLKRELLAAISKSRHDGDGVVDRVKAELTAKMDALQLLIDKSLERQHSLETHVERDFMRRADIERAIERIGDRVDKLDENLAKRLTDIASRLPPGGG